MKSEFQIEHKVATFPNHGVHHARQLAPQVSHEEIDIAIARARMLHAEAIRRIAARVIRRPLAALLRLFGRLAGRVVRRVQTARLRRQTMDALYALDARMLRDIGIERGEIPLIAASLNLPPRSAAITTATVPASATDATGVAFKTARAA